VAVAVILVAVILPAPSGGRDPRGFQSSLLLFRLVSVCLAAMR